MTYTRADYEQEMKQRFLAALTTEERLRDLKPEERLSGLTEEQIRAYLEQIQRFKHSN